MVENAISGYRSVNNDAIPPVEPQDAVVLVQSRVNTNELYQLWYGTSAGGYTVISGDEVRWILGETLQEILLEKNQYYSIESRVPFLTRESQPVLDYLERKTHWTRTDFEIGIERSGYYFSDQGGIYYQWGEGLLNRPYNLMGLTKIGIATPAFKFGILTNQFMDMVTGYVGYRSYGERLAGANGGFGSFTFNQYSGEFGFTRNTTPPLEDGQPGDPVNYIDFYSLGTMNTGYEVSAGIEAVRLRLGAAVYRVAHQQIDSTGTALVDQIKNGEPADPTYSGGLLLRVDFATPLVDGNYPKFEGAVQYLTGTGLFIRGTYNVNSVFSIPVTVVAMTNKASWDAQYGAFLGFRVHLGLN